MALVGGRPACPLVLFPRFLHCIRLMRKLYLYLLANPWRRRIQILLLIWASREVMERDLWCESSFLWRRFPGLENDVLVMIDACTL